MPCGDIGIIIIIVRGDDGSIIGGSSSRVGDNVRGGIALFGGVAHDDTVRSISKFVWYVFLCNSFITSLAQCNRKKTLAMIK